MTAFIVQLSRRLAECWLIESPSSSTMSLIHYIVGLTYYPMVALSLLRAVAAPSSIVARLLGALLFAIMSGWQHMCHRYLASLRTASSTLRYPLPQ
jgi:3-oxo-5-alpha-steroid 4-dehydrogenase 3